MISLMADVAGVNKAEQQLRQQYKSKLNEYKLWLRNQIIKFMLEVKNELPKKTGRTAESIRFEEGPNYYAVTTDSDVVMYLEEGTEGHGPTTGKALRFVIDGRVIYTGWVQGIQPHNIIQRAADRLQTTLEEAYTK